MGWLSDANWAGIAGIVGILALLAAIYPIIAQRKKKSLAYEILAETSLVSPQTKKLEQS